MKRRSSLKQTLGWTVLPSILIAVGVALLIVLLVRLNSLNSYVSATGKILYISEDAAGDKTVFVEYLFQEVLNVAKLDTYMSSWTVGQTLPIRVNPNRLDFVYYAGTDSNVIFLIACLVFLLVGLAMLGFGIYKRIHGSVKAKAYAAEKAEAYSKLPNQDPVEEKPKARLATFGKKQKDKASSEEENAIKNAGPLEKMTLTVKEGAKGTLAFTLSDKNNLVLSSMRLDPGFAKRKLTITNEKDGTIDTHEFREIAIVNGVPYFHLDHKSKDAFLTSRKLALLKEKDVSSSYKARLEKDYLTIATFAGPYLDESQGKDAARSYQFVVALFVPELIDAMLGAFIAIKSNAFFQEG